MKPDPVTPWIVRPRPNPGAALRLLCLPYAGGGAAAFRTWPDDLPAGVELLAIEPPGRGTRFKEPPFHRLSPLVAALTDAIAPHVQAPFAIYGHSLGALIGFCLARELRRRSHPGPLHLFVSGRRAPHLPEPRPVSHRPEPEFRAALRRLGGIPDAVFDEPELMNVFLPILRADFAVSETEQIPDEAPLACPITALGGVSDEKATLAELDAWHIHTSAGFDRETFPGGHFFVQSERAAFLGLLARRLSQLTAAL